jgi:catechol 2,3-dioxygenase-like lactoylglutathione lyase family enzyme
MGSVLDRIIINVPDLAAAVTQYEQLLGVASLPRVTSRGATAAWLGLPNVLIELVQCRLDTAAIGAVAFSSASAGEGDEPIVNPLQLDLSLCNGRGSAIFRRQHPRCLSMDLRVDHLVLRTEDAQACIELFADQLGMRLALDKTVPQWGGRMLFFRAGKLTLEVIESDREQTGGDFFWGIAYQCPNLEETSRELAERGVLLSEIRDGRKPGTRVATVKSHCLGIPTLLIEPA